MRADAVDRTNSSGEHALEHMRKELGKIRTGRATPCEWGVTVAAALHVAK